MKNVSVNYLHRSEKALDNVSLSVEEGEFVALVGPLLSGKTTLLFLLNGLIPNVIPAKIEGEISVAGKNPRSYLVAEMAPTVGLVLDDPTVQVFSLTVKDDVAFGPINLGMPLHEIEERVEYAVSATRLKPLLLRHPKELSGGQQQALSIAGVLAMRPKVLALDEPISMLDPIGKSLVLEAIKDLNKRYGMTCIIAESGADLEDVLNIVNRVVVLDKGKIIFDGTPDEAVENSCLKYTGVGAPQVAELFERLREIGLTTKIRGTLDGAEEEMRKLISSGRVKIIPNTGVKNFQKARGNPVVIAKRITYVYPNGVRALDGVDLMLYERELTAIIGQNGSGKSTLALTLVGVYKPTNPDAEINVLGLDVIKADPKEVVRKINYVFQNPSNMLFSKTVEDELSFGPKNLGYSPKEIEKLIDNTLNLLGIPHVKKELIIDLPRYLRTLVALASILILEPKIIIIDEPTSGLDRKDSLRLMEIIKNLKNMGTSLVIITHDRRLVSEFADRVIVMADGKILLDGTPREVFSQREILDKASLKPPQITELAQNLSDVGFRPDVLRVEEFIQQIKVS
ncbi:MAG: ATP-binding cassette domain-containing protein [Candidatus Caldarchaeum sp.]